MNPHQRYYDYLKNRSPFKLWVRRFFIKDLTRHFSGRVLDIGCGIGEFLGRYPDSIGVDINHYLARYCAGRGFLCSVANIYDLPFPDGCFDGVLISNVLEHLEDASPAVKEAARVLKPNGRLVITAPFEAGFRHDSTHVLWIGRPELRKLAESNGFEIVDLYSYPALGDVLGKYLYFFELRALLVKR